MAPCPVLSPSICAQGGATPVESIASSSLELCSAPSSSLAAELSGSGTICFIQNPLRGAQRKENVYMLTEEGHESQEKETGLRARYGC